VVATPLTLSRLADILAQLGPENHTPARPSRPRGCARRGARLVVPQCQVRAVDVRLSDVDGVTVAGSFVQGVPARAGAGRGPLSAKGVTQARSAQSAPGSVVRATLPQGSHAPRERSERINERVGGWVSLLGDSLPGGGGSEGRFQGGKPSRGRRGTALCRTVIREIVAPLPEVEAALTPRRVIVSADGAVRTASERLHATGAAWGTPRFDERRPAAHAWRPECSPRAQRPHGRGADSRGIPGARQRVGDATPEGRRWHGGANSQQPGAGAATRTVRP
jgi:hypothetical protein